MGCVTSKKRQEVSNPNIKPGNREARTDNQKNLSVAARTLEAIKREDIILFEKTIKQNNVKPNETVGLQEQKKTILHVLAEHNFAPGMQLILEYYQDDQFASNMCNVKDANGNTPVMVCVLNNAYETLEVMLQFEFIDTSIKNSSGKTAYDIAVETDSNCAKLLANGHHTRITSKTPRDSVSVSKYPTIARNQSSVHEEKADSSLVLKSLSSLTKEQSKLDPSMRLYQVLGQMTEKKTNFVDEEFPHDIYSNVDETLVKAFEAKHPSLKWHRPQEIFGTNLSKIKIFESIDLAQVDHSPLFGCDLYSALAAMTEYPAKLLKIFTSKEVNKYGAYSVNFMVSGIPLEIMLDDYFPCDGKFPIYSKSKSQELWFMLLEKAFAKLYGCYNDINNIYISEALEILTGMPSSQQPLKGAREDDLWNSITEFDKRNYILCVGNYKKDGYNGNRIFTIVGLHEVDNYKIVKMRNPWEDYQYNGTFADGSKNWTDKIREEVGYYKGEKSSIYMDLKEVMTSFDFLSVCYHHDNWIRNRLDVKSKAKRAAFIELHVDKEQEIFISVHQKLPRFVNESPEYDISPVEIIVADVLEDGRLRKVGKIISI